MTGTAPRSATPNAGDGKAVSENGRRGTANGRVGRFGRSLRPARRIPREPEAEIAWKVAFSGHTLTGGKPNGECRVNIAARVGYACLLIQGGPRIRADTSFRALHVGDVWSGLEQSGMSMAEGLKIRESAPGDLTSIKVLYPQAFPEEDLLPLVRELLREAPITVSLVAIIGSSLVGHVIFTRCGVAGSSGEAALLGPLAVAPAWQRQGIGGALVRAGLQRLENAGLTRVYVLGDPAYYGRLGFVPEARVAPPYPLPAEWRGAWQSTSLGRAEPPRRGKLSVPQPWLRPALWAPKPDQGRPTGRLRECERTLAVRMHGQVAIA